MQNRLNSSERRAEGPNKTRKALHPKETRKPKEAKKRRSGQEGKETREFLAPMQEVYLFFL